MQLIFTSHNDRKTIEAKVINIVGCELSADNKPVAYFDRDSGGGYYLIDENNDVIDEGVCYQLEIQDR